MLTATERIQEKIAHFKAKQAERPKDKFPTSNSYVEGIVDGLELALSLVKLAESHAQLEAMK